MFETILIRKNFAENGETDAGLLAEALLFYQDVHLTLDHGTLIGLLKAIGHENLTYLIENKFVKATYYKSTLGTHSSSESGVTVHDYVAIQLAGHQNKPKFKKGDVIRYAFERALGSSQDVRRAAKKFIAKVPSRSLASGFGHDSGVPGLARDDLEDSQYLHSAVEATLGAMTPNYALPSRWKFRVIRLENGFVIDSDLDFEAINLEYHKTVPPSHSTITPAQLLTQILDARADICLSSNYLSELVTTPTSSRIMQLRFSGLLQKRFKNANEIELFQNVNLHGARSIRAAINSGERKFSDF